MNIAEKIKPSTDLVLAETLKAEIVFAPGGVDAILEKIRNEVQSFKGDISAAAGRDQIRSMAYKVARSKTALDDMGKGLVADWKQKAGKVDAERRRIREQLDALKDEVRKSLDDWEAIEKDRIDQHEAKIEVLRMAPHFDNPPTSIAVAARIKDLIGVLQGHQWQEFDQRALETYRTSRAALDLLLKDLEQREAERIELERLRREQAEREQRERDQRIAAEAAERARAEAEAGAMREAEEAAARAEAERTTIERERAEAVARADKAERDRLVSEQRAMADALAAAQKAERDRDAAIEAERKRVADAAAKEAADTARREADKRHKAKINNEILAALLPFGVSKELGVAVIAAIARGQIPHTKITY